MIDSLVFKGGGTRGVAYCGALKVLRERAVLSGITQTFGTSAGALTALLVALRYTPDEIHQAIRNLSFSSLQSGFNIFREIFDEGLYSNKHLFAWTEQMTAAKLGPNATFERLKAWGGLNYHCVASVPAIQDVKIFSWDSTPATEIAWATVASMSIPGFFPKVRIAGIDFDLVDGGLIENYAIGLSDPAKTLGLFLHNPGAVKPLPTETLPQMFYAVFQSALAAQDVDDLSDPEIMKRSVVIDTLGISSTDFHISAQDQDRLFQSGVDCTNKYFSS